MTYIPLLIYTLSAIALASLCFCIHRLVKIFTRWEHISASSTHQATIDIPKADRYSVCIRRDRFWLLKEKSLSNALPRPNFIITKNAIGEQIPYHKCLFGVQSRSISSKVTAPVGYFDAPSPGKYSLINQDASHFLQDDEIVIRKHLPISKFVLLVLGIIMSSLLFLAGLITASLILAQAIHI